MTAESADQAGNGFTPTFRVRRGLVLVFLFIIVASSLVIIVWREESRIRESSITGSTVKEDQDKVPDNQHASAPEEQGAYILQNDAKDSYEDINASADG
ncbi:MAG: hypothetical protein V1743_04715 [Nanoarchaeota archaeon]